MNREEKSVLKPMITRVAASEAHSGCGSGRRLDRSQATITPTTGKFRLLFAYSTSRVARAQSTA